MKVLVTGAKGFIGKNLVENLKNISDGKDKRPQYQNLLPLTIYEFDKDSSEEDLRRYCSDVDFVFNLAGVNRPKDEDDYMAGNYGFASVLLDTLEKLGNKCPIMLSSSTQATLTGRFAGSEYGKSKLAGEKLFLDYARTNNTCAYVYRFPNVYGKWCRPNYNSAIATFCNNIANDTPITINNRGTELEVVYIDDLVQEMLNALLGKANVAPDGLCYVKRTDVVTLGQIVDLLHSFKDSRDELTIPDVTSDSFSKKLYSTYLSYLPETDFAYPLKMNVDDRGSFTEILKTPDRGQVSVNISKPGITKGEHWHNTKWEKFCVVSGEGLIRLRKVGKDDHGNPFPVIEHRVSGNQIHVIEMIPGYTHSIINLSSRQDLVTVMWCNECFDPLQPDTFFEEV